MLQCPNWFWTTCGRRKRMDGCMKVSSEVEPTCCFLHKKIWSGQRKPHHVQLTAVATPTTWRQKVPQLCKTACKQSNRNINVYLEVREKQGHMYYILYFIHSKVSLAVKPNCKVPIVTDWTYCYFTLTLHKFVLTYIGRPT